MPEVRIHGRGGQGAVLASKILAKALVLEGWHVTAIPSFGFERRGAPVASFLRFETTPIRRVNNIYAPDYVLCIDPTVGRAMDVFAGMPAGGTLVQTTKRPLEALTLPAAVATVGLCDAVGIARGIFGRPITNAPMLGAFARTTGLVAVESLVAALGTASFRDGGLAQNETAVARGFEETTVHHIPSREAAE